ncbi:uracil-DNA glycosylase [Humidisolicoccus flavus]|uniref:uracil-DNA glycosylase n=1 Tax=Humidisolicoccus flavus TaxID=3111414 RepID=UPI003245E915
MNAPHEQLRTLGFADDWALALSPVAAEILELNEQLREETASGLSVFPPETERFRAFRAPLAEVRVLVLGQDPYPTRGHAMGLAFSVNAGVRPLPRSLRNIDTELLDDLGCAAPAHGDLSQWSAQGVLLLNRVLSVREGEAGSHRGRGWERITQFAIEALIARGGPLVAVLWGNDARRIAPLLGATPRIESAHPSPLSARRGFFGSKPFSRVNALLNDQGATPINWCRIDH